MPNNKQKQFIITLVAAFSVLAAVLYASGSKNVKISDVTVNYVGVAVTTIDKADSYKRQYTVAGRIEAQQHTSLAFDANGQIKQWMIEEGDDVIQGQPLATLDDRVLQARLAEINASITKSKAQLQLAELTVNRLKRLKDKDIASQQLFDEAVLQRDLYLAQLDEWDARAASAKIALQKATLTAPFSGKVVRRFVDNGAIVSPNSAVVDLIDHTLRARISLPQANADDIALNAPITLIWNERELLAHVTAISPVRRQTTQTVDVLATLETLLPGMRVGDEIAVQVHQQQITPGYWLPLSALNRGVRGAWNVFVVNQQNTPITVSLKAVNLEYQQGDKVFVTGALSQGDVVVMQGGFKLAPGQAINIIPEASHRAN